MEKKMEWRSLEGYDLVIVWAPFTALQHSCILLSLSARRHVRAFNFPGWHVCILYIAYHEYSMIDPSGTNITGTSLL